MPPYKHLPIFWVYHINVEDMWNHLILQDFSFHLPKRTGHFPDKTPLALHIGFQIFRALPICLPDCFPLLRQKAAPSKVKTLSELYHKNFLFFTRWHETTIFREWKAKKSHQPALVLPLIFFNFTVYYHAKPHIITETHIQTRKLWAVSVFVLYPPFFNSIFSQTATLFRKNRQYPTPFYLSVLYYHGNPGLLRESILLPDSTIFAPIAILSAASKNTKKRGPPPTVMNPTNPKNPWF